MNPNHYREQRDFNNRQPGNEYPYKRPRIASRSTSPRPYYQTDQRFKRPYDSDNRSPRPYENRSQPSYNRPYEPSYNNGNSVGDQRFNRENSSPRFPRNNDYRGNGGPKKIRTEFPECILYEYGFLASPQRGQRSTAVYKLMDPNLGKNEVDEVLATITTAK